MNGNDWSRAHFALSPPTRARLIERWKNLRATVIRMVQVVDGVTDEALVNGVYDLHGRLSEMLEDIIN